MIFLFHTSEIKKAYIVVFEYYFWEAVMKHVHILRRVSSILELSKTDIEIIKTLVEKEKLLASELAAYVKRSERHVRERISRLLKKGILNREIEILANRRLAYRYYLRPLDEILHLVKSRLMHEINEIEKIAAE